MIVLAMIGPPASGKSTLASVLKTHGVPSIRVSGFSSEGTHAATKLGVLAPDGQSIVSILDQLASANLLRHAVVVIDGFPRTAPQAEALVEWARSNGSVLVSIMIGVRQTVLESRLADRRVREHRTDDSLEIASRRRREYDQQLAAMLPIIEGHTRLVRFNDLTIEKSHERVIGLLDSIGILS
jgi:adenylate kinase